MRVLLYCDDPGYGGTAINASLLAAGLAERDITIGLAAGVDLTPGLGCVSSYPLGYDTQRLFKKTYYSRNEPEAVFLAFRPDVVLFCDGAPDSSLAAKAVCRDWGLPYVVLVNYVAPSHIQSLFGQRQVIVEAYAAALAVVAVSVENLWLLQTFFRVETRRSMVIHYGRPAEFFTSAPSSEREKRRRSLGVRPDDILCLTVARYEPRKGYQHLLSAIRLLAGHSLFHRLRFVWIGHSMDGGQERLAAQVAASGLGSLIAVLGQRDDIRDWLAAADVFVLPSESEGMPLCVTEAMGQGLPVVATAVSGVPEQVGKGGILVPDPNQDTQATAMGLAQALVFLAQNPQCRQGIGRMAKVQAMTHFTAEAMVSAYAELLQSLATTLPRPHFPVAATYRPPHAAPFGREICFGDDQAASEFLREGWGHGEGDGRWTVGSRASLVMAVDDLGCGLELHLRARAFLGSPDEVVGLEIRCNGRELGCYFWTGEVASRELVMVVPVVVLEANEMLLEFIISGASSPFSHGQSDDTRLLGIWVSSLRLERIA